MVNYNLITRFEVGSVRPIVSLAETVTYDLARSKVLKIEQLVVVRSLLDSLDATHNYLNTGVVIPEPARKPHIIKHAIRLSYQN